MRRPIKQKWLELAATQYFSLARPRLCSSYPAFDAGYKKGWEDAQRVTVEDVLSDLARTKEDKQNDIERTS